MGLLLRFSTGALVVLGVACNAQVATVLASDADAAAAPAPATCTSDSVCNEDPTLSSLRGRCRGGVCVCDPGSVTTASGRCGDPPAAPTPGAGPVPVLPDPAFCSGSSAKMRVNGEDAPILDIRGKAIAMGCCDSALLTIATGRFAAVFHLLWRVPASRPEQPIDLATLGAGGGGIELDLGCDPSKTSCSSSTAVDRFDTGFAGTVRYTPTAAGMDTSYCVKVAEPPGDPNVVLHSVELYVPTITATY